MKASNLQFSRSSSFIVESHAQDSHVDQSSSKSRSSSILKLPEPTNPVKLRSEGQKVLPQPSAGLRRFTGVLVGLGTVGRALLAIGTLGISEGIKAGIDKLVENSGTKKTPQTPITITVPGTQGKTMDLDPSALPGRIPKGMTQTRLQEIIQAKVDAGHDLVSSLTKDEHSGEPCTVKDMSNIMFFLQVKAESQKGSFPEGAFTLSDPDHRIAKFLDSCPQGYQRESSHITDIQRQPGCNHRGIDAYGSGKNFDELLPHGMKTLLYGKIPDNGGDSSRPGMYEPRLYLKIESHGAWLTRPKGGDDKVGPHRTGNHHDVGAILGHSLSFINSRGKGSAAGTFKERIPDSIKNGWNDLRKDFEHTGLNQTLGNNNPTSSASGIRVMLHNVNHALMLADGFEDRVNRLTEFKKKLEEFDHPELRIGNEIIFTDNDMIG